MEQIDVPPRLSGFFKHSKLLIPLLEKCWKSALVICFDVFKVRHCNDRWRAQEAVSLVRAEFTERQVGIIEHF